MLDIILFGLREVAAPISDFIQLPTPLTTVTANSSNFASVVSSAAAGTRILLDESTGTFNNVDVTNNNGTLANPVVICPANKNDTITFRGKSTFRGSGHLQIFGCEFDGSLGTPDAVVDLIGQNKTVAYCVINPYGIGITADQSSNDNIRITRTHFTPPILTTGSIGKSSWKFGSQADLSNDNNIEVDWCLFDGPVYQREQVSGKCAGIHIHDCQFNRNSDSQQRDIAIRHGRNAIIERVRAVDHDIVVQATGHIIRNCVCDEVILAKGFQDGDLELGGSSAVYLSAKRCVVQQITGDLHIGGVPFADSNFTVLPDACTYSNISGTVTNEGTNTGTAPTIPAEIVPTITSADVGLNAYRTYVTNAP